ncbi:MAG: winged helix-turn-helix domain-containing protein [Candidatus Nanoarchaeia archaeon]
MKRERLEILRDTLKMIQENRNQIRPTILLRKSKMSSIRFKEYYNELISKGFIKENHERAISLTEKGFKFLERYHSIIDFINEFEL